MNNTNSYMFDIQSIIFARINEVATEILVAIYIILNLMDDLKNLN